MRGSPILRPGIHTNDVPAPPPEGLKAIPIPVSPSFMGAAPSFGVVGVGGVGAGGGVGGVGGAVPPSLGSFEPDSVTTGGGGGDVGGGGVTGLGRRLGRSGGAGGGVGGGT